VSRRQFLLAAGALAAAPLARGQTRPGIPTLGILSPHRPPPPQFIANNPFTNRLRTHGWVEGRTLAFERAYAGGREDRLPALAAQLVQKQVDVIWTVGVHATLAAARLRTTIPVVFWGMPFPVEQGVVASLSRPGGNVTGVAFVAGGQLWPKLIATLRDIAPHARRLASLATASSLVTVAGQPTQILAQATASAAAGLGFEARQFNIERKEDVEPAFAAMNEWKADSLVAASSTVTFRERERIVALANRSRVAGAYAAREFVAAGGLGSYGLDAGHALQRIADIVDRVLRGEDAGEIPVALPDKYELAVNLTAARALGLTIPQSLLVRANKVIE